MLNLLLYLVSVDERIAQTLEIRLVEGRLAGAIGASEEDENWGVTADRFEKSFGDVGSHPLDPNDAMTLREQIAGS